LAALAVVSRSDMAAPLPRRLAVASAGAYRLKLFEPPYASPPFEIMALSHRDHGNEPAIMWLREVIHQVATEL
jgi:DNA-binding transcriptional LysR family regulator